jgi:large subunit ribosomal protein L25
MSIKTPILKGKKREHVGTRYSRRIRQAGGLPAVVYGHGQAPLTITLDAKEALSHFHKGEKVFQLSVEGLGEGGYVLLKEVQFDFLGTTIVHCDLARVDLKERVRTRVPLRLVGESKGLRSAGAILMHPVTELEIECSVLEIPDHIDVEIGELDVGHAISAADVKLPSPTMKLLTDPHGKVAQIVIQQEEVVATEAAAVEGAPAEPEVITAKKKDEEGAEGAEGEPKKADKAEAKGEGKKQEKKG